MNNDGEAATESEEDTGQANSATVLLLAWVATNITFLYPLIFLSLNLSFGPGSPLSQLPFRLGFTPTGNLPQAASMAISYAEMKNELATVVISHRRHLPGIFGEP